MKTKSYIITLLFIVSSISASAQFLFGNYIKTDVIREAGIIIPDSVNLENAMRSVSHFDGLGRPIQTIQREATTYKNDLVTAIKYDHMGRQLKEYLPFTAISVNSNYIKDWYEKDSAFYENPGSYISSTDYFWSEREFEASPRGVVLKQGAPGADWQLDQHPVGFEFSTNNSSDKVLIWDYNPATGHATSNSIYADGTIYVTQTKNENGNISKEYKDIFDNIILKTSYLSNDTLYTYYVYDQYGNLGTIIPPKAYSKMVDSNNYCTANLNEDLVYIYKYDYRNRLVEKKIPGQDTTYMLYDKLDRLILVQDGNMRVNNQWLFTKYDAFSRPIITGIYTRSSYVSREAIQSSINNITILFETFDPITKTYSDNAFPNSGTREILTETYYDNYDFITTTNNRLQFQTSSDIDFIGLQYVTNARGLATGAKVKIIGTNDYLLSATYYDKFKRPVQSIADHAMDGYNVSWSMYDFLSNVKVSLLEHRFSQSVNPDSHSMKWWYSYDHTKRLIEVKHQVNNQQVEVILQNRYNEIGQLIEKNLHANNPTNLSEGFWQSVDYRYNIRGWMTHINDAGLTAESNDLFGMELNYNEGLSSLNGTAMYNGNISGIKWIVNDANDTKRAYGFQYDEVNRLLKAEYGEGVTYTANNHYDVSGLNGGISYDENGNILSIYRKGENTGTTNFAFGDIDQLSYTYNGNQLIAVNDYIADISGGKDFKDGSSSGNNEYTYDANGNMICDENKGIINIIYNILKLPIEIDFGNENKITYIYDALGKLLKKEVFTNGLSTHKKTYAGKFVYNMSNSIEYIITNNGRLVNDNGVLKYQYYIKDHLNSNRVTFTKNNGIVEIVQQNHYYPFGMSLAGISSNISNINNNYKYNGKEFHEEHGINWYSYGNRYYDPTLARWSVIDNKAEIYHKLSPYVYSGNNPVIFIDYDGDAFGVRVTDEAIYIEAKIITCTALSELVDRVINKIHDSNVNNQMVYVVGGKKAIKNGTEEVLPIRFKLSKKIHDGDFSFPRQPDGKIVTPHTNASQDAYSDTQKISNAVNLVKKDGTAKAGDANNQIINIESIYDVVTLLHELGHVLGISHSDGIMAAVGAILLDYSDDQVGEILAKVGIGKTKNKDNSSQAKGVILEGEAKAKKIEKGKVFTMKKYRNLHDRHSQKVEEVKEENENNN